MMLRSSFTRCCNSGSDPSDAVVPTSMDVSASMLTPGDSSPPPSMPDAARKKSPSASSVDASLEAPPSAMFALARSAWRNKSAGASWLIDWSLAPPGGAALACFNTRPSASSSPPA